MAVEAALQFWKDFNILEFQVNVRQSCWETLHFTLSIGRSIIYALSKIPLSNPFSYQRQLDLQASEIAQRQDESDVSRKKLVELSREYKKNSSEV